MASAGKRPWKRVRVTAWVVLALLNMVIGVGWVRSYFTSDDFMRMWSVAWMEPHPTNPAQQLVHEASGNWVLSSGVGSLGLWEMRQERVLSPDAMVALAPHSIKVEWNWMVQKARLVYNDALGWNGRWGFMYHEESFPLSERWVMPGVWPRALKEGEFMREWVVSYWVVMLVVALPWVVPAVRFVRQRRRVSAGHCAGCGYDLRMHALGARCPECGRMVEAETPGRGGK